MDRLVAVGRVVRVHGLRGELVVATDGDTLVELGPDDPVWLGEPPIEYRWAAARVHKGRVLLTVSGIADRTAAEALRGAVVRLELSRRSPAGPGEAYVEDLVGCRLVEADGDPVGTIVGVADGAAHDLMEVDTPAGRIAVPMVREWLVELRLDAREVVMRLPEGLVAAAGGAEG